MPGPNDVCCIPTTVDQAVGWPCLIATYGNVKTSSAGPRNRLLSAEDAVRRVRLRGRELINTVTRQRLTSTGSRPIAAGGVFSVNDRSTLELDLRRSRRANPRWRQQSFAEAGRRSRQSRCRTAASDGYELALPTQRSPWRLSGRTTGPPWKLTFADLVEKIGVRRERSLAGVNRRTRQDRGRTAASESREQALPTHRSL